MVHVDLNNKRLLLIAPMFFGYYREMIYEAENMGLEVDYICDAPSNSNISKAVCRINRKLITHTSKKYFYENVMLTVSKKYYDFILVVAGMTFALLPDMIKKLKQMFSRADFILYQWDSESNLPYCLEIHKYFDRIYSFDRLDCNANKTYHFLPLFYCKPYEELGIKNNINPIYDCSYVGTAHPKKFKEINNMSEYLIPYLPKQLIIHYMPSKLKYIYHKFTAPEYKRAKLKDFIMEKVSTEEIKQIFRQSRCILDASQSGQTGLTIRTIECLGAKRKLVTTNTDIKNYDFYNENNILVFNGVVDFDSPFFTLEYEDIPLHIYKKYSLRYWLKTMLHGIETEE